MTLFPHFVQPRGLGSEEPYQTSWCAGSAFGGAPRFCGAWSAWWKVELCPDSKALGVTELPPLADRPHQLMRRGACRVSRWGGRSMVPLRGGCIQRPIPNPIRGWCSLRPSREWHPLRRWSTEGDEPIQTPRTCALLCRKYRLTQQGE